MSKYGAYERLRRGIDKDPVKTRKNIKKWKKANPEKAKEREKKMRHENYVKRNKKLSINFVANQFGLKLSEENKGIIELKRLQLQITREIRKQKKCQA